MILVFALHQYTPENQQLFRDKLPSDLFYYSNWLPTSTVGPFFCAWSLAVEEQFYLVFGLLLFLASRRVAITAVALAFLVKLVVYQLFGPVEATSAICRIFFSYREPILLGVLTAFALNRSGGFEFFRRWLGRPWVATGMGVATVSWLCFHLMRHESSWDAQLLYVLMTLTLITQTIRVKTPVLGGALMVHVGKVSYGIYLLHMFVISTVRKLPGGTSPLLCFFLSSLVVITLASLVYQFFERPIITFYKRRLSPVARNATASRNLEPVTLPTNAVAPPPTTRVA